MAFMNVILVAFAMSLCLHEGLGYRDDDEKEEMSNKEIKENFDILTNEIKDLKKEVKELRSKTGPSENQMVKNISVLSASRRFLPDGQVCFTVQYKAVGDLYVSHNWMLVKDYMYISKTETMSNEIPRLPRYVYQSSLIVPPGNDSHVMFLFGTHKEWIHLYLQNAWEGDVTQTDIELPFLEVVPEPEFVYEPGHNISVKITSPQELERGHPGDRIHVDNFRADYKLVLPEGTEIFTKFNSEYTENFFTKGKVKKFLDKIRFEAELNTAEYPLMGILDFMAGKIDANGFVVIEYGRQFVMRPSTQKGPFPDGQLYASGSDWHAKNDDGEYEKFCVYGEPCGTWCEIFGDHVTNLKLYETFNGKTALLPMKTVGGEDPGSYRIVGNHIIDANPGSPSPVTYTCMGSNAQGRIVTRKTIVYIGEDVKINRNQTIMKMLGNGKAVVNCTASGQPRPKISITCDQMSDTEPEVIYQTDDVISVTTTCHGLYSDYPYISCTAENKFRSDYETFSTYD